MKITTDTIIESYITTRNEIKALEDQISELKAYQSKKEEYLLSKMLADNTTGIKSKHGTVYVKTTESIRVSEPDTFFQWVKDNEAWECIEKRAAKTAILQLMGEQENDSRPNPPPPGLDYVSMKSVGVRKS